MIPLIYDIVKIFFVWFHLYFTFRNETLKMSATFDQKRCKVEKSIPGLQMFHRQIRKV
jgi:hypothetical protein